MKSILISIKPKWVAKILNGEKTIEIRKTMPKCDLPIDVYIYCTKTKETSYVTDKEGKVVAKFTLNKVEEIMFDLLEKEWFTDSCETEKELLQKSQLTQDELDDYLGVYSGYAWHISNLIIFDKPKDLLGFGRCELLWCCADYKCNSCRHYKPTKIPQSWCYIEILLSGKK